MKRFFSLLALVAAPVVGFTADAMNQKAPESKPMCGMGDWFTCGPVNAADECWASRVELGWGGYEHGRQGVQLNTIQPLYRADDIRNTVFAQAGLGLTGHDKNAWALGLGYRYLTVDTNNMFGINLFYNDGRHKHHSTRGYRTNLEWFTNFTTLTLGRETHGNADSFGHWKTWNRMFSFDKAKTTLDLAFQLPYLPWTTLTLGKDWRHHERHDQGFKKLNYILNLNLLSCVGLQMGYKQGWNNNQFIRLVLNFGRPAVSEHTMLDKFFADEAFTARDLRNYTLKMVDRETIGLYR